MALKTKNFAPGVTLSDQYPDISLDQKLQEIDSERPKLNEAGMFFDFQLPYDCMITVTAPPNADTAELNWLGVGSTELQGHGIGSRLLDSAVTHLRDTRPEVSSIYADSPRLGTVATMAKVLGEDYVTATMQGKEYGGHSDNSLDQMLRDYPIDPNQQYMCDRVVAQL